MHPVARWGLAVAVALAASVPCMAQQAPAVDRPADSLRARTGVDARVDGAATGLVPPGVRVDDGVTSDEAVALALWNNAAFQVSVTDLGFARADLVEAGIFTNPVLSLLLPIGPKQLEATLRWPIEVLWERPRRVRAARLALDAASERLVQAGLDLVLAVRTAYADATLAADRARLAQDAAALLARIDTLTQSRLAAGDISELEARTARVDAARAALEIDRARADAEMATARLMLLVGQPADQSALTLAASTSPAPVCASPPALVREALVARPDVRAAEIGVHAAAARLGWEQSRILAFTAVLDANGRGTEGFEIGPGIDLGLPVFNRNQGGKARAQAQLRQASAMYTALQQRVGYDVREAAALFDQAQASLTSWRETIVGPLEANVTGAERSFQEGDVSYLFVLENTRRLFEARVRERELVADQQRAQARIERAVGRSCSAPPREVTRDR